jgi:hypothetical protein
MARRLNQAELIIMCRQADYGLHKLLTKKSGAHVPRTK